MGAEAPADVAAEFRQILEEHYDVISRYWPVLAVIKSCATEMPELEAVYFGRARPGYCLGLASYPERCDGLSEECAFIPI